MTSDEPEEFSDAPAQLPEILPVVPLHQLPDINLVAIAHMSDFVGFPLMLYMPWGIAAGHTASPNAYYQYLGERARGGGVPPDAPEGWNDLIDEFAKNNFDAYSQVSPSDRLKSSYEQGWDLLSHINLKNVSCWIGGFPEPTKHEYLRVRLADVTAWAWGTGS